METKRLEDAIEEILVAMQSKLEMATQDGNLLQDVKSIVRGDRTAQKPVTPAIWIFSGQAIVQSGAQHTIVERWELPVQFISVVYNTNSEEGFKEANSVASRAKSVIIEDRTLGFGHGSFFADIQSRSFDCGNPAFVNGNYYSAIYTAMAVFCVRE